MVTCKKAMETGIYYQNRSWENNLLVVGWIKLDKNHILLCDLVIVMNEKSGSFTRFYLLYKEMFSYHYSMLLSKPLSLVMI